jgi:transketolase
MLAQHQIDFLSDRAKAIRLAIIEMLVNAHSGHTAGPLGLADIYALLYFQILKHDPKNPTWPERDRLIVSNGHTAPVLYATLALAGYLPTTELKTLRKYGSRLQGHPHREWLPGLETSSGPLGSGLAQGVGMALADRLDSGRTSSKYFYVILSDGELDCGATWEAVMMAGKEKLHNLIVIIDRNHIQIGGDTETVMPLEPLADKWRAFNWQVFEADGHNFADLAKSIEGAKGNFLQPAVIIAHTIPGKGVPEFEGKFEWHGKAPTEQEGAKALDEIKHHA